MKFQVSPTNRPTRVLALLVLLSVGTALVVGLTMPLSIIGVALVALMLCLLFREGLQYSQERWRRRDRYSLTLLDDTPHYRGPSRDDPGEAAPAPDWESEDGDAAYCHRCDSSMPAHLSICPRCGSTIGH